MNEAVQQPNQNLDYKMVNATVSGKKMYMRNKDMAEFEKELETSRLAAENARNGIPPQQPSAPANVPENPTSTTEQPQTVDWQKRYSDLQSHSDKKVTEATNKLNEETQKRLDAENKLKESVQSKPKYPTSEEELAAWVKDFPPLLPIIQTIALKATEGRDSELKQKIEEIAQFQKQYANEKGRMELLKIHPDANEIEADPRFAQWFKEQEPEIQLLISSGDPKKIGKAISIYKKDLGIVTRTAQDLQKEASKFVDLGPTPPALPKEQRTWYESEVNKMSQKQYAANERDIELARAEGRYVYDISRAS